MELVIFMICTITVFLIKNIKLLALILILNYIIILFLKISIKNNLYNLKLLMSFILFTVIVNSVIDGINNGLIIFFRLIICYNITYIFSNLVTINQISRSVKLLFYPLRLFKIDIEKIGTIVSVSLCMVPILRDELVSLIKTMKSRGKMLTIKSFKIIIRPMLISILNRTNEIEKALINKGYQ